MKVPAMKELLSRKGYIVRLGVVVVLISILPLAALSVITGQSNRRLLESQVLETNRNYLSQTINAAEMVVSQIDQTFFSLGSTEEMTQFATFLYGSYYEKLSGAIKETDAVPLYEYLNRKKAVVRYLGVLQAANQAFHSVIYVDRAKDLVLTSVGSQYTLEEFGQFDLLGEDQESRDSFYINSEVRKIGLSGDEVRVISLIFPTGTLYDQNVIIINIDVDKLYDGLLKNLSSKLRNELIIAADNGQFLYDRSSRLAEELMNSPGLFSSAEPSRVADIEGRRVLVTRQKSDRFGWSFYSIISLDEVYKAIGINNSFIFIATAVLLIFTLSFGFMEVRNFYKPVNRLVELVRQRSRQPQAMGNEMAMIEGALRRSMLSREIAREGLGERLLSYQEQFLRILLDGGLDEHAVLEGFEYFALPISPFNLRPILFHIEPLAPPAGKAPFRPRCAEVIERLQSLAQERHRCVALSMSAGYYLLLINQDGVGEEGMEALAGGLRQEAAGSFGVRCVVGIGRRAGSTNELPAAVAELQGAFRSRSPIALSEIFLVSELPSETAGSFVFFREHEKQLLEQIRSGSREEARQSLSYVLDRVFEQNQSMQPRVLQYSMAKILTDLIVCANELGLDLEKASGVRTCLYEQLLRVRSPEEYAPWFYKLLDILFDSIPRESSAFQNEHVRAVQRLIRSEAGRELTLTLAAELLGLNPSYLSRVLKEKTGRTFMDFITEARIESSREMLLKTNLKVEEISDKIGYSNANYFIKIFRRHTGVTPGEFRRLNRSQP